MVVTVNDRAATRQAIIHTLRGKGAQFLERSQWHARSTEDSKQKNDWNFTKIAIHHAGRAYRCGSGLQQMFQVQNMHRYEKKFDDIGYHYAIDCMGDIYEGRDIRFKGEHLEHNNTGAIGIVLLENLAEPEDANDSTAKVLGALKAIGLLKRPTLPDIQVHSLKTLIKTLSGFFHISILGGHSEYAKHANTTDRSCPGTHGLKLTHELRIWSNLTRP